MVLFEVVSFNANVIQYWMDQLHDAPTEDSILYVHWYVWTTFAGLLIVRLPTGFISTVFFILFPIALILLGTILTLQRYKRNWFIVDSGSKNPYKLVFKVLKFAKDHLIPFVAVPSLTVRMSFPPGLIWGRRNMEGPSQLNRLRMSKLLTTGPLFAVDIAVNEILPILATKSHDDGSLFSNTSIYTSGLLTPLIVVVLISLYIFLLRPFIHDYIPGMLKRMGLEMVLFFISGLCTLVMGMIRYDCMQSRTYVLSLYKSWMYRFYYYLSQN